MSRSILMAIVSLSALFSASVLYAHTGDPDPSSTFDRIQHRVFNQSCALQSCHGSNAKAGNLVLEEGEAYRNLVNVDPDNPTARAAGKKRVLSGDPDRSFLWNKISAHLLNGEGAPMPLGSAGLITLNPELTEVIRKWIVAGAPQAGIVQGTQETGTGTVGKQPAADPLAPPAAGQGFQVTIPAFALGSLPETEGCLFVRLPNDEPIYVSGYEISMRPGSHHFIVYRYDGDACDRDNDNDGTPNCLDQDSGEAFPPQFMADIGCNDLGPADRFRKSLIGGSQTPHTRTNYPSGIALKLEPHQGLLLNAHYINFYEDTQGEVTVNIYTTPPETVEHEAKILFDVLANGAINVPPFTVGEAGWAWSPTKQVAVLGLTSHMHKRGTLFTIDYVGDDGTNKNPPDGPLDSDGNRHLYVNTDYADPANLPFTPPLILEPGERLAYTCTHDNGLSRPVKMGCEETVGVAPGTSLNPARRCTTNDDCAGFGTGRCVPANLVFGPTSDDEMCIMPGLYYELTTNSVSGGSAFSFSQVTRTTDNVATPLVEEIFTPSISGNGSRVVFASNADPVGQNADGSLEVFTADLSTTPPTVRQLTSSAEMARLNGFPVISNDGTTIAFTSNADLLANGTNSDGNVEMFVSNFDGSNLRQLTNTTSGTNGPSLSVNGELLNLLGLAISGNGDTIVFTSTAPLGGRSNTSQEIFLIRKDGTGLRQLTTGTVGNASSPTLAINGVTIREDGTQIAFSSTGNYTGQNSFQVPQLFSLASDGSGLRQLTTFTQTSCDEGGGTLCIGVFVSPAFSDDGSRIGFLRLLINLDNISSPELQNTEPFAINADGTGLHQLFDAPSPDVSCSPPVLNQSGSQVTFICTDNAAQQSRLYVNTAEGGALQPVTETFPEAGVTSPPTIDDTGTKLVFTGRANPVGENADGNAELFVVTQATTPTAATLENPRPGSIQSGIGVVSGWACQVNRIDLVIDDVIQLQASYGTERGDTLSVCGDTNNGFSLLVNWNLLTNGTHTLQVLADGVELARTSFTVNNLGAEFLRGLSGECTVPNFPQVGTTTPVHWEESLQNFVIGSDQTGTDDSGVSGNATVKLENPTGGSTQNGISIVSGWACQAGKIEIVIDGTLRLQAGYGTDRADTRSVCGDSNNGFALLVNWNLLANGPHTLSVLVDDVEVANIPFTVTNLGTEFLTGVSGECTVANFPQPGATTRVRWEESLQRFIVVGKE